MVRTERSCSLPHAKLSAKENEAAMDEINLDNLFTGDGADGFFLDSLDMNAILDVGESTNITEVEVTTTHASIHARNTVGRVNMNQSASGGNRNKRLLSKPRFVSNDSNLETGNHATKKKSNKTVSLSPKNDSNAIIKSQLQVQRNAYNLTQRIDHNDSNLPTSAHRQRAAAKTCNEVIPSSNNKNGRYKRKSPSVENAETASDSSLIFTFAGRERDGILSNMTQYINIALIKKIRDRMDFVAHPSCGLEPSTTFCPFMNIPKEVSMHKISKHFPILDLICTQSVAAQDQKSSLHETQPDLLKTLTKTGRGADHSNDNSKGNPEASDIVLMQIFRDYLGISSEISSNTNSSLKAGSYAASSAESLVMSVKEVRNADRLQLIMELEDAWRLIQRQSAFFRQNLNNIATWCHKDENFESIFDVNGIDKKSDQRHAPAQVGAGAYARAIGASLDSLLGFYLPPTSFNQNIYSMSPQPKVLVVKVKFQGNHENGRKNHEPLLAILSPQAAMAFRHKPPKPESDGCDQARQLLATEQVASQNKSPVLKVSPTTGNTSTSHIQKKILPLSRKLPSSSDLAKEKEVLVIPRNIRPSVTVASSTTAVPYNELEPMQRRKVIAQSLTETAHKLQKNLVKQSEDREEDLYKREKKIAAVETLNTTKIWSILDQSRCLTQLTGKDAKEALAVAWHPELPKREMYWNDIPTPVVQRSVSNNEMEPSSSSLYYRLQSLLVEEITDQESQDSGDHSDDSILFDLPEEINRHCSKKIDEYLDVSRLSLDQRAYIQLRALNLIDTSVMTRDPEVEEIVTSSEGDACKQKINNDDDCDDIADTIRNMQAYVSEIHRQNNQTASLLQHYSESIVIEQEEKKRKEKEHALLIEKHNQIVRKQKESKRSRTLRRDLPW